LHNCVEKNKGKIYNLRLVSVVVAVVVVVVVAVWVVA